MIERILIWLLTKVMEYLFGKAETEVKKVSEQLAKEKEREAIDEKNVIKYQSAKDRSERIKRAAALLNGDDAS